MADKYLRNYFARDSKRRDLRKTAVIDKYGNLNPMDEIRKADRDAFATKLSHDSVYARYASNDNNAEQFEMNRTLMQRRLAGLIQHYASQNETSMYFNRKKMSHNVSNGLGGRTINQNWKHKSFSKSPA